MPNSRHSTWRSVFTDSNESLHEAECVDVEMNEISTNNQYECVERSSLFLSLYFSLNMIRKSVWTKKLRMHIMKSLIALQHWAMQKMEMKTTDSNHINIMKPWISSTCVYAEMSWHNPLCVVVVVFFYFQNGLEEEHDLWDIAIKWSV